MSKPASKESLSPLQRNFIFYAAYHDDRMNQLVHMIFVPLIFWSALVLTWGVSLASVVPPAVAAAIPASIPLNVALAAAIAYGAFYLYLSPGPLGLLGASFVAGSFVTARAFMASELGANAFAVGIAIQVVGWAAQVYAHKAFEGRSPALLDNLFASIFMAPLFVLIEYLRFFGVGGEFEKSVRPFIDEEIAKFKATQAKKN